MTPSATRSAIPERLLAVLARASAGAAVWLERAQGAGLRPDETPWALSVPDISLACEVLLADRLFHDLSAAESAGLARWIRAQQQPSGAWHLPDGGPADLSLTAFGWWALVEAGDDPNAEHLVRARRVVHELGGAQRANGAVRIWLAMAGHIPWSWVPTLPAELWLLPPFMLLSPSRVAPWGRGVMTPYLLLSRAPARVHVSNAKALLLTRPDGEPILPRLTAPGLAGDLLQSFDQAVKVIRKLPRGPILGIALGRVQRWLTGAQQRHGGWFSARPTLLSLLALRVLGASYDDPRIRRGLDYLRRARGRARLVGEPLGAGAGPHYLSQGLLCAPLATTARLVRVAAGEPEAEPAIAWLLDQEITEPGEWQLRVNAPAGGWPCEPGADRNVDTLSTCAVLDALAAAPKGSPLQPRIRAASRRAVEVLLAMQEPDGGFARFERGESDVFMTSFPIRDVELLTAGDPNRPARVRMSAMALRQLARLGFQGDDDRVARGLAFLWERVTGDFNAFDVATLSELSLCAAALCPPTHPLRQTLERQLRGRQREDGSFGSPVATALAAQGLMALEGAACIQTQRALRDLARSLEAGSEALGGAWTEGFGISPVCHDPSAGVREAAIALAQFTALGGSL